MDKEKNESHPFARYLHETEEILWMDRQANLMSFSAVSRHAIVGALCLTVLVGLMFVRRSAFRSLPLEWILLVIGGIALFSLPIGYALAFFQVRGDNRNKAIYAVTNERLFYCDNEGIEAITLESVPSVKLSYSNGEQGSLSFGEEFSSWLGVADVAHVKQLIESAQYKRISSKFSS